MKKLFHLAMLTGLALRVAAKTIPNFAKADLVLGQRIFSTAKNQTVPNPATLSHPTGIAIDPVSRRSSWWITATTACCVISAANRS